MRVFCSILSVMATACSAAGTGNDSAVAPLKEDPTAIIVPAEMPAPGPNDVIGATPGPCGSTGAQAFLGRPWSPELAGLMRQASGASQVVVRTGENPNLPPDDRRLNVMLNDREEIVLLDCG